MEAEKIKQVLEAAILASDNPLDRDALLMLFDEHDRPEKPALSKLLEELSEDYADRGIELREVGSGFRFQVRKDLGPWVSRLWAEKPPRYSRAIMETLALIAYRQPITRGEIEEIRGVAVSTNIIKTLQERAWVRVVGHRDVPGRPAMFATTRQFLDYFDLKSLEDLPPLSEIKDLDKLNEELELEGEETPPGTTDAASGEAVEEVEDQDEGEAAEAAIARQEDEYAANDGATAQYDEEGNRIPAGWQDEPDIDESRLMDMDKVDSVLKDVEESFRKKPEPPTEQEEADNAQGGEHNEVASGTESENE